MLKRHPKILTVNEMQFAFMSEGGMTDAVSILRRLQQEHNAK